MNTVTNLMVKNQHGEIVSLDTLKISENQEQDGSSWFPIVVQYNYSNFSESYCKKFNIKELTENFLVMTHDSIKNGIPFKVLATRVIV